MHIQIEEFIEATERIVYRFTARGTHDGPFMGVPASGRKVEVQGIGIDRVSGGKTVERWLQYDSAGLLQQLGAIPS
jgi:predicted ester cyclase